MEHEPADRVAPGELEQEAARPVEQQVGAKDAAGRRPPAVQPRQEQVQGEVEQHGVDGERVDGYAERGAHVGVGPGVGVSDGPGEVAVAAPAAPGHQAADASDGLSQGDRRCRGISHGQERQAVPADEDPAREDRREEPAEEDATGTEYAQQLGGVVKVARGLHDDERQLRTREGPDDHPEPEVEHPVRIETAPGRAKAKGPQPQAHGQHQQHTVRRKLEGAEVDQDGVHVRPPPPVRRGGRTGSPRGSGARRPR